MEILGSKQNFQGTEKRKLFATTKFGTVVDKKSFLDLTKMKPAETSSHQIKSSVPSLQRKSIHFQYIFSSIRPDFSNSDACPWYRQLYFNS